MAGRGRSFTQPSEWDSHDDYNESTYNTQYTEDSASVNTNLDHCRLYITNIPRGLNDEGLRTAFSKFGTLVEVYLSKDPHKKFGLLRYETPGEAKLALMKMNRTEPLKLNISIAHKAGKKDKDDDKRRDKDWQDQSFASGGRDRSTRDESGSTCSKNRSSRPQEIATDAMTNGDNNTDELLEDDYGFSDILDPNLTLELEALKMEQLKVKEEQLQCKHRMIILKQQEKSNGRPLRHTSSSNRCVLPDGKIVVRNVSERGDSDLTHGAGAGDSRLPALQKVGSRKCVTCGQPADSFCARCGVTPYCSHPCQVRDWLERHRDVCHNLASLSNENKTRHPAVDIPRIQNPAPLRRPHVVTEEKRSPRPQRNEDANTTVSDKSDRQRTQERPRYDNAKKSTRVNQNPYFNKARLPNSFKKAEPANEEPETPEVISKPEVKPVVKEDLKPEVKVESKVSTPPVTVPSTPPVNGTPIQESLGTKPATIGDVTPTRKMVPKNYLIEQLSTGDSVLLSVDATASSCRSSRGDFVCLSMHEKYEVAYQSLCEDFVIDCDADSVEIKPSPGDMCSYFNKEDGGWYRARCLTPTCLALVDSSKTVSFTHDDKIRKLPNKYEQVPEFCCVLECNKVEIGTNLKCVILSKCGDGNKVSIENVDSGASVGEGVVFRWIPTVEYAPVKAVIPEVPRPAITNNSRVLLVDATSLERAFVRPADTNLQRQYDDVVQNALLAGLRATPLTEPPVKGQTVIAKFTDGLHYRALCKRTHVAQNKYLLEYIEYGNTQVCRNLSDLYPCPPELSLTSVPTQVSMIKLSSQSGELTPPAAEYIEKLKNDNEEIILTLPNGEASAPSGSEANLKLMKNSEMINKKIVEMCTPDWKKFEDIGGDVVEVPPLMYSDLEYKDLPPGPVELEILDVSVLQGGMISGYLKGDPHADHVFTHVTQKIAEYCNSELGREPYLPKIEELCIAQCPPYPQWFRAVLVEQVSGAGGQEARVCYVDYGNVECVPVSLLRKMLPEFVRGIPVVVSHLEIKDFPKDPSDEMILRAAQYLKINDEGRGQIQVRRCVKQEEGLYVLDAPDLIKAIQA